MNNIKAILLLAFLLLIIVSCNKNLTQSINDTQSVTSVSTTADVLKVLQGTYGILQNQNMYKEGLLKLILLCGDDFTSASNHLQLKVQCKIFGK